MLVPSAGIRGFLDASEYGTWLKFFRPCDDEEKKNVRHFLLAGQIYYETTRDVAAGEELTLGPKEPITLGGGPGGGGDGDDAACDLVSALPPMIGGGGGAGSSSSRADSNDGGSEPGSSSGGLAEKDHNGGAGGGNDEEEDDDGGVKCLKCEKSFIDIFT